MSKPPLFRTPHTFQDAGSAVEFFNSERAEGVDPIGEDVLEFLESIHEYDSEAVYNVQPGFRTFYVAVAHPEDHHPWFYAKPDGVVFQLGDERNVEAVLDMYGRPQEDPPQKLMDTDVWFSPDELGSPAVEFCLRLAASWATWRVGSKS